MIISCINCNKKFDINSNLIPLKGRLLECSSCNHQWFFEKEVVVPTLRDPINNNEIEIFQNDPTLAEQESENLEIETSKKDENATEFLVNNKKIKGKFKILNLTIVFIISFIALIIFIDTFKTPISEIIPNIEFILYNLYETIKDIFSFLKDLI
ncbi:zinc-ribbon domain-containing protein [Candidatus Pelagibacter sp.]|nr:zinc-ribbon domain-containing protein [Candidatus Pelagibacter sp.]